MTTQNKPSTQDLKSLYNAALDFRDFGCWDWMDDTDIFGVQNPATEEIGYCCVIGANREMFGLIVYLGTEGLDSYYRILSDKSKKTDSIFYQKCLIISFENKNILEKIDLDTIKSLGLNIKGSYAYPMCREYTPGFYPWFISPEQIQFLTLCLQQAKEVAGRFKENRQILFSDNKNEYLVRGLRTVQNGIEWQDMRVQPKMVKKNVSYLSRIPHHQLDGIKSKYHFADVGWEFDCSYSFNPLQEKKNTRPYYPRFLMCVDKYSAFILQAKLIEQVDIVNECQYELIKAIEQLGVIPKLIEVMDKDILSILRPITTSLGIDLQLVKNLKVLRKIKKDMEKYI
ncbi:MAG: hypothetical protein QME58_05660 [Bacteroidota bacterium]|nr:hypothetical protein [Bacteroidota bacterium]